MPTETALTSNTKILHLIMSSSHSTTSNPQSINVTSKDCLIHSNGSSYTVSMAHVTYWCLQTMSNSIGSLIDGGANGGFPGTDVHVLEYTEQYADIMGVGQPSINALPLVTCAGTIQTTQGSIVLIMNQYTYNGKGSTVDYVRKLSHFGLDIDDHSSAIPGHKQ